MNFVGIILDGRPIFKAQPIDIIKALFHADSAKVPNILNQEFHPMGSHIPELVSLIREISNSEDEEFQDKIRVFNDVIHAIPSTNISSVYAALVTQLPLSELGKLASFFTEEENLPPFIAEVIKHHANTEISHDDAARNCMIFIDQMISMGDLINPSKIPGLSSFLLELYKIKRLHSLILCEMHSFDDFIISMILWSLPAGCISDYVALLDIYSDADKPARMLTELFSLEENNDRRAILIKEFTDNLDENDLHKLFQALVNANSCVIPFLCTGLSDEKFDQFIFNFSRSLRGEIFEQSIPDLDSDMVWIINNLKGAHCKNRLATICDEAEFDQPAQEIELSYLTLKKFCEIIKNNKDDPDNFLKYFQDDIEATPPFLFVLGMHHPEWRNLIIPISILLREDQLEAICLGLPEHELCASLDELFSFLRDDQILFVLESLSTNFGILYIRHKTEQLSEVFKEIKEAQSKIKSALESNNDIVNLEDSLTQQQRKLRILLTRVNLQLKKYIQSIVPTWMQHFKQDPLFLMILDTCQQFILEIEGQGGFFQHLQRSKLQNETKEVSLKKIFRKNILEKLKLQKTEQLSELGIKSSLDLNVLSISPNAKITGKMKRYLEQK